jgi:stage IV sporulation protein B
VKVDVVSNKQIAACGNTVGVKIKINGILVIGVSDVDTENGKKMLPSRESGIKPGYIILQANDKTLDGIDDLINEIDRSHGKPIKIKYKYGSIQGLASITPVISSDDKRYHIGLWVRDNTAGIGTLTFYDPATQTFGALGHGITDVDTGTLMPVETGEILESSILGVKKGTSGTPGELKGIFVEDTKLGSISLNSEFGIYGKLNSDNMRKVIGRLYPIGVRSEIKEGRASILSNIDGKNIDEFSIDILKVSRQSLNGSKGMIIKVTDPRLLETTGGIVQGMSGSPIMQNGKIIGAVTHVLVNDPTRGYGIFIEAMIRNVEAANTGRLEEAS